MAVADFMCSLLSWYAGAPAVLDEALQNHWLPTEHPSSQEAAKIKQWLTVH